jgi:hypothetical protein
LVKIGWQKSWKTFANFAKCYREKFRNWRVPTLVKINTRFSANLKSKRNYKVPIFQETFFPIRSFLIAIKMKKKPSTNKDLLEFLFSVAAGLELFQRIDDTNFSNMLVFLF